MELERPLRAQMTDHALRGVLQLNAGEFEAVAALDRRRALRLKLPTPRAAREHAKLRALGFHRVPALATCMHDLSPYASFSHYLQSLAHPRRARYALRTVAKQVTCRVMPVSEMDTELLARAFSEVLLPGMSVRAVEPSRGALYAASFGAALGDHRRVVAIVMHSGETLAAVMTLQLTSVGELARLGGASGATLRWRRELASTSPLVAGLHCMSNPEVGGKAAPWLVRALYLRAIEWCIEQGIPLFCAGLEQCFAQGPYINVLHSKARLGLSAAAVVGVEEASYLRWPPPAMVADGIDLWKLYLDDDGALALALYAQRTDRATLLDLLQAHSYLRRSVIAMSRERVEQLRALCDEREIAARVELWTGADLA